MYAQTLSDEDRRLLRIEAYALVWPVVFDRLTRRVEINRGHYGCASSLRRLQPSCLDKFHDDVEAAVDDLLRNAKVAIVNLEGWVSKRLKGSTIDAYRRRRGERGALQRPRLPRWLESALHHDPQLMRLALAMLEWVGLDTPATVHTWPIGVWSQERVAETGDCEAAYRAVAADVDSVQEAMKQNPRWYADYVIRPLSRKQVPLATQRADAEQAAPEPWDTVADAQHEGLDSRRRSLADTAIQDIVKRVKGGQDVTSAVRETLTMLFIHDGGAQDLRPGEADTDDQVVAGLLASPEGLDRIVALVLELLPTLDCD